jgi:hypothetical protein
MRGALIVGGVAVLGLGAWWLYKRNRDKADREQLAINSAAALERRDRARAFLWTLRSNPLLRAQASPAVILQNEVAAGVTNQAVAGNRARATQFNYVAGSV